MCEQKGDDFINRWPEWLVQLPEEFLDTDYKWAVDPTTWTVRDNDHPYDDTSFMTIIDGFLVSPNIEIVNVKGHDLAFKHSDHNPVTVELRLIGDE